MYKRPNRRQQVSRLVAIYTIMTLAVVAIVSIMVMFVMGYRFDASEQRFEQTGLVQFNTQPGGSVVEIDKKRLSAKTATKRNVTPGVHEFAMWQPGYETWWKSLDIKAGSLTWLDYARLVPKERQVSAVKSYEQLDQALFSPGGRFLAAWPDGTAAELDIVDLRSEDEVKNQLVQVNTEDLFGYENQDASHSFKLQEWDQSGRYLLLTHKTGDQLEWVLLDRENPDQQINVSSLVDLPIQDMQLSGTDGNLAYILTDGMVRRVNIETGQISRALVSRVDSFDLYSSDIITYVGRTETDGHQKVVGVTQADNSSPYILKTVQGAADVEVNVDTARYFNQNYVAVSVGSLVEIYRGDYPSGQIDGDVDTAKLAMPLLTSFEFKRPVEWLQFSDNGRFVVAQDGRGFMSYDLERQQVSELVEFSSALDTPINWLDSYYIWTVEDGQLVMQEFDGANRHVMNQASQGYDASLGDDGSYIYSILKTEQGVDLQRLDMVL